MKKYSYRMVEVVESTSDKLLPGIYFLREEDEDGDLRFALWEPGVAKACYVSGVYSKNCVRPLIGSTAIVKTLSSTHLIKSLLNFATSEEFAAAVKEG